MGLGVGRGAGGGEGEEEERLRAGARSAGTLVGAFTEEGCLRCCEKEEACLTGIGTLVGTATAAVAAAGALLGD